MPIDDAATRTLRAAGIGLAPRNERLATAAGRHPAREVSYRLGYGPAGSPVRSPRTADPSAPRNGQGHRYCARPTCSREAVATMSYDQGARTVFLGGLSPERDPAFYDLCRFHVDRLTPPTGWTVDRGRPTVVAEEPAEQPSVSQWPSIVASDLTSVL